MWGKPDVLLISSMVIAASIVLLIALTGLDFKAVLRGIDQVSPALACAVMTSTKPPDCPYYWNAVQPRPRIRRVAQSWLPHLLRWADRLPLVSSFRVQHPWVQFLSLLLGVHLIGLILAGVAGFRFESAMAATGLTMLGALWGAAGSTGSSVFDGLFEKMPWRRLLLFPVAVLMTVLIYGNHLFLVGTTKLLGRFAVANCSLEAMCMFPFKPRRCNHLSGVAVLDPRPKGQVQEVLEVPDWANWRPSAGAWQVMGMATHHRLFEHGPLAKRR